MPAIAHHKPRFSGLRRVSGSFNVAADGFIDIRLRFIATPDAENAVTNLFPRLGQPLPGDFVQGLSGLPNNRGVFAENVAVVYENGIQYVDIVASSCVVLAQFSVSVTRTTLAYLGFTSTDTFINAPYRFVLTVPNVAVSTCYLYSEGFPDSVSAETGGIISRFGAPSLTVKIPSGDKSFPTPISNIRGFASLKRAAKTCNVVQNNISESPGSIVRGTKTYTLEVAPFAVDGGVLFDQ
jgi:hypothetical protein